MKLIADTNVLLAVVLEEPEKDLLVQLTAGHEMVAPEILPFELGNALTALVRKGALLPGNMLPVWHALRKIRVELRPVDIAAALRIAAQYRVYAYDAYFLECAAVSRCPLLTLDGQMKRIAVEMGLSILE